MGFDGDRLAAARLAARVSQVQLAATLGIAQERISVWERGLVAPRPAQIPAIAAAVGMDALELVGTDLDFPRLSDLRLAAGLSLAAMAQAAGTTITRYRRLERGETVQDPQDGLVERVAVVLAVPAVTVRAAMAMARTPDRLTG